MGKDVTVPVMNSLWSSITFYLLLSHIITILYLLLFSICHQSVFSICHQSVFVVFATNLYLSSTVPVTVSTVPVCHWLCQPVFVINCASLDLSLTVSVAYFTIKYFSINILCILYLVLHSAIKVFTDTFPPNPPFPPLLYPIYILIPLLSCCIAIADTC